MTNRGTYLTHDPVALTTANGWRAAYITDAGDDEPGWVADPLIAWVVCHVTERPCMGSVAPVCDLGSEVHGYIYAEGYVQCAEDVGNFWRYLAPEDADPTPGEVRKEQTIRADRRRTA